MSLTIKQAFEALSDACANGMKNPFFVMRRLKESFADVASKVVDASGDKVTVTPITDTGTKIAEIKVNNTTSNLYAPSAIHNYSTTEQLVGKWIDGSDLYEKTISFTTGNTDAYLNYVTDIENPVMMSVDFSASYYISDDSTINAMPYFGTLGSGDSNAFAVLCNKVDDKLRIDYRVGSSAYSKSAVVTVRYTKSST